MIVKMAENVRALLSGLERFVCDRVRILLAPFINPLQVILWQLLRQQKKNDVRFVGTRG